MSDAPAQRRPWADDTRWPVPVLALAAAAVANLADPGALVDGLLTALPVAALAWWALLPRAPLAAVAVATLVPVVLAQRDGALEPVLFDACLLGYVAGRWAPSTRAAVALGLAAAASPLVAVALQDPAEINVGVWLLGIAFPWIVGRASAREAELAARLDVTRRELAEQALLAERRRIARDVHDIVGHGLAAVLLQVTSARHVLRRDADAAEDALRAAEDVGRRSMRELRRTVELLRGEDEAAHGPLPSAREIPALVEQARAAGLAVELRMRGDLADLPAAVDVAAYRIAQEALANAVRHAPHARTVLELGAGDDALELRATTRGPIRRPPDDDRARFGVVGMRERAASIGGRLEAGPADDGWEVACRLPLPAGAPDDGKRVGA